MKYSNFKYILITVLTITALSCNIFNLTWNQGWKYQSLILLILSVLYLIDLTLKKPHLKIFFVTSIALCLLSFFHHPRYIPANFFKMLFTQAPVFLTVSLLCYYSYEFYMTERLKSVSKKVLSWFICFLTCETLLSFMIAKLISEPSMPLVDYMAGKRIDSLIFLFGNLIFLFPVLFFCLMLWIAIKYTYDYNLFKSIKNEAVEPDSIALHIKLYDTSYNLWLCMFLFVHAHFSCTIKGDWTYYLQPWENFQCKLGMKKRTNFTKIKTVNIPHNQAFHQELNLLFKKKFSLFNNNCYQFFSKLCVKHYGKTALELLTKE